MGSTSLCPLACYMAVLLVSILSKSQGTSTSSYCLFLSVGTWEESEQW